MDINFDTTSSGTGTNGITWSHTCSGTNRVLFVAIGVTSGASHSVTYGGQSMTQLLSPTVASCGFYYLFNPPSGANNIVVTGSGGSSQGCAASYNNVSLGGNPEASNLGDTGGAATTITSNVTTLTNKAWVVGLASAFTGGSNLTAGSGSTQRINLASGGYTPVGIFDSGVKTPAGSVSMTVNLSSGSARMFYYIYAIKPAVGAQGATLMMTMM